MTFNVRPISRDDWGKLRLRDLVDCRHASDRHLLPIAMTEFPAIAADMPIAFVKNNETQEFQAVAVTGLAAGENLFMRNGEWTSIYIPQTLAVYPLTLIQDPQDLQRFVVGYDQNCPLVNQQEGELLIDAEGVESDFFKARKQQLVNAHQSNQLTHSLIAALVKYELLREQSITLRLQGTEQRINGLYLVDERKLAQLSDEDFMELRRGGFLPAIYAHILSLHQMGRLAQRKAL